MARRAALGTAWAAAPGREGWVAAARALVLPRLQPQPNHAARHGSTRVLSAHCGVPLWAGRPRVLGPAPCLGRAHAAATRSFLTASTGGRQDDHAASAATTGSGKAAREEAEEAKMFAQFTCGVCGTKVSGQFAKGSYQHGVVLMQCDGCKNRHVIADNLGWFSEHKNVEEILKAKGEAFWRSADGTLEAR